MKNETSAVTDIRRTSKWSKVGLILHRRSSNNHVAALINLILLENLSPSHSANVIFYCWKTMTLHEGYHLTRSQWRRPTTKDCVTWSSMLLGHLIKFYVTANSTVHYSTLILQDQAEDSMTA